MGDIREPLRELTECGLPQALEVMGERWSFMIDPALTYAASLDSAAHWYRQYERLAAHWLALYPDDVRVADYDALISDPEAEIAGLLSFLDLEWEDACLTPHRGTAQVRTASAWQVREPLYTRSYNRWRNYAGHLDRLIAVFGEPNRA